MTSRNVFKCPLHDDHLVDYKYDEPTMTCPECGMQMEIIVRVSLPPPFPTVSIDELMNG